MQVSMHISARINIILFSLVFHIIKNFKSLQIEWTHKTLLEKEKEGLNLSLAFKKKRSRSQQCIPTHCDKWEMIKVFLRVGPISDDNPPQPKEEFGQWKLELATIILKSFKSHLWKRVQGN